MHSSQQAVMHNSLVSPGPGMSPDALPEWAAVVKALARWPKEALHRQWEGGCRTEQSMRASAAVSQNCCTGRSYVSSLD